MYMSERPQMRPEQRNEGMIDTFREKHTSIMNESRLPTADYESTVGVYGGKIVTRENGDMVFDMTGVISRYDRKGDAILRTFDEHVFTESLPKLLWNHPKLAARVMGAGPRRARGAPEEIAEHAKALGLDDMYALTEGGIQILQPEVFTNGRALKDIYRADMIQHADLLAIDRFEALAHAAQYVRKVHDASSCGIGELLSSDIIFVPDEQGDLSNIVMNIPDIVYRASEQIDRSPEAEKRDREATDMLDFLFHMAVEEFRRSEDWEEVRHALTVIVENYGAIDVLEWVRAFAKKGRLTLYGDQDVIAERRQAKQTVGRQLLVMHNRARLDTKTDTEGHIRQMVIDVCDTYIEAQK